MYQNTSHAVMAQRIEAPDSLDDFPTPPWATRALMEHIIHADEETARYSVLEPACGRGHMAQTLREYFNDVRSSDIHNYGYGAVEDFLEAEHANNSVDWIITNPPFRLAEEFLQKSMEIARVGVALLVRLTFAETVGRYERIYRDTPPTIVAPFSERVPMCKGRLNKKGSTATAYAWFVWKKPPFITTTISWIPPCRKLLEDDFDYEEAFLRD